jgi:hypothetical protein
MSTVNTDAVNVSGPREREDMFSSGGIGPCDSSSALQPR